MNPLYKAVIASQHYVFVNNGSGYKTHANGTLYLGPHCVFLKAQLHQKKTNRCPLKGAAWGRSFPDAGFMHTSALIGGRISKTVKYRRLPAALTYVIWIAGIMATGMVPVAIV